MADHPKMPVPQGDLSPQQLADGIRDWAVGHGYAVTQESHASEFCKVVVRDQAGELTRATIPNAHHGRRLQRQQIRYVVQQINNRWS